jgi:hypothetical protein
MVATERRQNACADTQRWDLNHALVNHVITPTPSALGRPRQRWAESSSGSRLETDSGGRSDQSGSGELRRRELTLLGDAIRVVGEVLDVELQRQRFRAGTYMTPSTTTGTACDPPTCCCPTGTGLNVHACASRATLSAVMCASGRIALRYAGRREETLAGGPALRRGESC